MVKAITFGDIRPYFSRIDRVSICMKETLAYQNYVFVKDVPHDYDRYYLYGFGIIDSEFEDTGRMWLERCVEFVLTEEPRDDI